MSFEFKVYKLTPEFHRICNWREHRVSLGEQRPGMLLIVEDERYPDAVCCIPISKDDDKNHEYQGVEKKFPHQVHSINFNQYDNYLLIQNMFYVRKEFIGDPFTVNGVQVEVKNTTQQGEILKKVRKMDALLKHGKVNHFVNRERVYDIQVQYLEGKIKHTE